jgi:hypothetical protein
MDAVTELHPLQALVERFGLRSADRGNNQQHRTGKHELLH